MLDQKTLTKMVDDGDIDTVLVCFTDLQGRLIGKRVTGHFFCEEVVADDGAIEACVYLLAVDVDMTPLPGYEFASWATGYGDFRCIPDWGTMRVIPWLDKTALVLCDLVDDTNGEPVEVSPRRILQRQLERATAVGYRVKCGSELEFFLFRESYEEAEARDFTGLTPHSSVIEDYHVFQTTRDEYLIRQIRNGLDAAGIPVEFSKGEAGKGQHEINLRYADALTMADRHVIYKNAAKEIAALNGRSLTFMAKYAMEEVGSSCHVHSSVWDADGTTSLMWSDDDPDHLSPVFHSWLGGLLAHARELTWCFAPTVNSYKRYQP
ncbi:MAG: glutamine synthetase family protein, partial [Acidimicrobiia bacterium]